MSKKKIEKKRKLILIGGLVISVGIFLFSLNSNNNAFAALTVVSPSNMQSWAFDVQSPDGFGTFVSGPSVPPLGIGSARLYTGTHGNAAIAFYNLSYLSINLSSITNLDYSTYSNSSSDDNKHPVMLIVVSTDFGTDVIRFDPELQSTLPVVNQWQTWDADAGVWTSSIFPGFTGGTLSQYVAYVESFSASPTIVNRNDGTGGLRLEIGPGSTPEVFDGNVDNFTIGINGGDITFDFEPDVVPSPSPSPEVTPSPSPSPPSVPTDKDQCKNGGWNVFRDPSFKNQGDCVSFVGKQK